LVTLDKAYDNEGRSIQQKAWALGISSVGPGRNRHELRWTPSHLRAQSRFRTGLRAAASTIGDANARRLRTPGRVDVAADPACNSLTLRIGN
jgi:hypothetical protein